MGKSRRLIAALVAVVLFVIAAVLLASYVINADKRATAGLEPTEVLVVTSPILAGEAAQLDTNVEVRQLPISAIADDSVAEVDDLDGRVASVDLLVGEQVVSARFVDPEEVTGDAVDVPAELAQVTISLDSQRTIGSRLKPGDTVGVSISYKVKVQDTAAVGENGGEKIDLAITDTILHHVLVTRVQGGQTAEGETDTAAAQLVTLATHAQDVQRIVWGMENGTVWLSLEREDTKVEGTTPVVADNVGSMPISDIPFLEGSTVPVTDPAAAPETEES